MASSPPLQLVELDSLTILNVVDNEVDPMSTYSQCDSKAVKVSGGLADIARRYPILGADKEARGNAVAEISLEGVCCGAHGLSLMITGVKDGQKHTVLFDTGPEEHVWEMNAKRLRADIGAIEWIQLSHWHRDHSGGMLRAIDMINAAKPAGASQVTVDLHPNRPTYRGVSTPMGVISLPADPRFEEIEKAGGKIVKNDQPHSILDDMFVVSGEIPRVTPYEAGIPTAVRYISESGKWTSDELILDERFLICRVKDKGVVVFTGCSHAGAVNATKHAMQLAASASGSNDVPLFAVVGGYHLVGPNEQTIADTIRDLKALKPSLLLPGHCTGWRAKRAIENEMPGTLAPLTVGTQYDL